MTTQILQLAGVIVASGAFSSLVVKLLDRRVAKALASKTRAEETKLDADAAQVIAETAVSLVAPLQAQIAGLAVRVATLEKENIVTTSKLKIAVDHIRDLRQWITDRIPHEEPPQTPPLLGRI